MSKRTWPPVGLILGGIVLACAAPLLARGGGDLGPEPKDVKAVLDKAIAYFKTSQGKDGSFATKLAGPGVSAIVAAATQASAVYIGVVPNYDDEEV